MTGLAERRGSHRGGFVEPSPRLRLAYDTGQRAAEDVEGAPAPAELPPALRRLVERILYLLDSTSSTDVSKPPRHEPVVLKAALLMVQSLVPPDRADLVPELVPVFDGSLQLEWHLPSVDIEVTYSPDGRAWAEIFDASGATVHEGDLFEVTGYIEKELTASGSPQ